MAKETKETKKTVAKTKSSSAQKGKASIVAPKADAAGDLREFLIDGLKDMYWAEKHLSKALMKMSKNSSSSKLKQSILDHKDETDTHITRLEEVFTLLGKKAQAVKCDAMKGLLDEANGIMEETEPGAVRDAAIIAAAQKVEHYEIASYGTLATYCQHLKEKKAMNLLHKTLEEERSCDELLTKLAVSEINVDALEE